MKRINFNRLFYLYEKHFEKCAMCFLLLLVLMTTLTICFKGKIIFEILYFFSLLSLPIMIFLYKYILLKMNEAKQNEYIDYEQDADYLSALKELDELFPSLAESQNISNDTF